MMARTGQRSWRRPFSLGLLLLLALLLGWGWQERKALQAFPDILSAYTAKEYCSCRYVMHNPADSCRAYVQQYLPISRLDDDPDRRQVSASGLGRSHRAIWLDERQGCRLQP